MLKFTAILKGQIDPAYKPRSNYSMQAEVLWVKVAQRKFTQNGNFEKLKKQFKLFCDEEGIWRCGGRLENANVPFHERHPILVPRDHHLATLIVRRAHARVLHNGVKDTLNEVRSRYSLVKGRAFVKKIVNQCIICRKFEGSPFHGPIPPPLPTFRLREDPPFTYTGVDFAGPLYIKTGSTATSPKVWICLYTCCVTRAIHLDVVPDLTTAAFIRSLKRFSSRRGLPHMFVSDNGKTFKAAVKTINAMLQHKEVQGYLSGVGIEWLFNLERAPWWGGVFERMVRMTKRCLRKMIGRAKLTFEELSTIVIEVEGVINSRPLTYLSPDDFDQPLTPAHLLCGRRLLSLPDTIYCKDIEDAYEMTPKHMTKRLTYLNRILNDFWKRWQTEYLSELRDAHRYGDKTSAEHEVKVGDIVLVHDDSKPRGFWKLALVEKLVTGRDGLTRGAVLRVSSSGERGSTLQRPLQRLYPLELSSTTATELGITDLHQRSPQEAEPIEPTVKVPTRPKRAAAVRARDRLKATALQEQEKLD